MGDSFLSFSLPVMLYVVSQWRCVFLNHLLGKQLDHVLVEMGYGVKPDEQSSKKQSMDPGEYTGSCWAGAAVRQQRTPHPRKDWWQHCQAHCRKQGRVRLETQYVTSDFSSPLCFADES